MSAINVAILEHLQIVIDGYRYRLRAEDGIEIAAVERYGERLEPLVDEQEIDVLILEPQVPASPANHHPLPIWPVLKRLFTKQPALRALVISSDDRAESVKQAVAAGVCGYILKEDAETMSSLAAVVKSIAAGGMHFSDAAHRMLLGQSGDEVPLTARQLEALALCAAYPNETSGNLALRMNVAASTFRSLLSVTYQRLDVRSRMAAVEEARRRGWIQ